MGVVTVPLWIVGAGGHGQDLLAIVEACGGFDFRGFLDDRRKGDEIAGKTDLLEVEGPEWYLLGVNDSHVRRALYAHVHKSRHMATFVHPSAVIGSGCHVRPGAVIAAGAVLSTNVIVGRHAHINVCASVSQGSSIGDFATVGPGARICGDVIIGRDAQIGAGAVVVNLAGVGVGGTVGAGAVVLDTTRAGKTVVGVPARELKK